MQGSTSDGATNFQSTLSDLKVQFALLKPEEKVEFSKVITSWSKLKNDAKTIQASLNTLFDNWRQDYKEECQASSFNVDCYLNMADFAENAAAEIQDDVADMKSDVDEFRAQVAAALKSVKAPIDGTTAAKIDHDLEALQHTSDSIFTTVDMIIHPSQVHGDQKMAEAIKAAVEADVNKFIAFETATFAMNELNRVARKVEVKLDEIDQKTWFILSGLDVAGTFLLAKDDVNLSLSNMTPEKQQVAPPGIRLDPHYLLTAAAAYACNKLGRDSGSIASDASDTEVLLYPIYVELISKAVPNSSVSNGDSATPAAPAPSASRPDVASKAVATVQGSGRFRANASAPKTVLISQPHFLMFVEKSGLNVLATNPSAADVTAQKPSAHNAVTEMASAQRLSVLRAALQANANNLVADANARHAAAHE